LFWWRLAGLLRGWLRRLLGCGLCGLFRYRLRLICLFRSRLGRLWYRLRLRGLLVCRLRRLLNSRLARLSSWLCWLHWLFLGRLACRIRGCTIIDSNDSCNCDHRSLWLLLNSGCSHWLLVLVGVSRNSAALTAVGASTEDLSRGSRVLTNDLDTTFEVV
jgi:hypothetical protein